MSLWSVVGGLWAVAGRWAVVFYYANAGHTTLLGGTLPSDHHKTDF